jgi:hypothetical protein
MEAMTTPLRQPDPLYVIFEKHLLHFDDAQIDRKTFVTNIVEEYFQFLAMRNVGVPGPMRDMVSEELSLQVTRMLVKKIYGCITLEEFKDKIPASEREKADTRYRQLRSRTG